MSEALINLEVETCQSVVDDLYQAYDLIDSALAHTLRTSARMIEVGRQAKIEPKRSQKIFTELTSCTNAMLEGRKGLVHAHSLAHLVRMDSTVADVAMIGCPALMRQASAPEIEPTVRLVAQAA